MATVCFNLLLLLCMATNDIIWFFAINVKTPNCARNQATIKTTWTWNFKIFAITNDNQKLLIKPFQAVQDCAEI